MKRNNFSFGLFIGLLPLVLAFLISHFNLTGIELGEKKLSFYILAALINLLLVRYYYRNEWSNTARGIILITFAGAVSLVFLQDLSM
jgi:hypothetical protein